MNEISLLALGFSGAIAIGIMNRNIRTWLSLTGALLLGFVSGEIYNTMTSDSQSDGITIVNKSSYDNNQDVPTVMFASIATYSKELLGQVHTDNFIITTSSLCIGSISDVTDLLSLPPPWMVDTS